MSVSSGRQVTLVLCTPGGELLGRLPPVGVASPYWQDVAEIVDAARAAFDVGVTVLRLLDVEADQPVDGGPVAYLAETADPVPPALLSPWTGDRDPLVEDPRRHPYARPGGPAADLAWADGVLAARGDRRVGGARQIRTWNLSSIWQLPTSTGSVWLKVVPPFLRRETAVAAALPPSVAPTVLASDGDRLLLADVPGEDQYAASGARMVELGALLVSVQAAWRDRTARILELGGRDRRSAGSIEAVEGVYARHRDELDGDVRGTLDELVGGLDRRFGELAACGLPDTLVHGDFHPGNVRGRPGAFAILDWGEAGVGHPALDVLTLTRGLPAPDRAQVEGALAERWSEVEPGSDLARALQLVRPVLPLLDAATYQSFLDEIEPDEWPYHAGDPVAALLAAAGH